MNHKIDPNRKFTFHQVDPKRPLKFQLDALAKAQECRAGLRGMLNADDRGLGKTLETLFTLYLINVRYPDYCHLIVVPMSVLSQWYEEAIQVFLPEQVYVFYNQKKHDALPPLTVRIVITTYGKVRNQYRAYSDSDYEEEEDDDETSQLSQRLHKPKSKRKTFKAELECDSSSEELEEELEDEEEDSEVVQQEDSECHEELQEEMHPTDESVAQKVTGDDDHEADQQETTATDSVKEADSSEDLQQRDKSMEEAEVNEEIENLTSLPSKAEIKQRRKLCRFFEHTWDTLVLDEGDRINNVVNFNNDVLKPEGLTCLKLSRRVHFRLLLSGTPTRNSLANLCSISVFLDPLGITIRDWLGKVAFDKDRNIIQCSLNSVVKFWKEWWQQYSAFTEVQQEQLFHLWKSKFMIHRVKQEIAELPPLHILPPIKLDLTPMQKARLQKLLIDHQDLLEAYFIKKQQSKQKNNELQPSLVKRQKIKRTEAEKLMDGLSWNKDDQQLSSKSPRQHILVLGLMLRMLNFSSLILDKPELQEPESLDNILDTQLTPQQTEAKQAKLQRKLARQAKRESKAAKKQLKRLKEEKKKLEKEHEEMPIKMEDDALQEPEPHHNILDSIKMEEDMNTVKSQREQLHGVPNVLSDEELNCCYTSLSCEYDYLFNFTIQQIMDSSAKLQASIPHLQKILTTTKESIIIFTETVYAAVLTRQVLMHYFQDQSVLFFHGSLPQPIRNRYVVTFQSQHPNYRIMLATMGAGGIGLNLTAATQEVFFEESFDRCKKYQCIDRCHRITQTKPVYVTQYLIDNAIDLWIYQRSQYKVEQFVNPVINNTYEDKKKTKPSKNSTIEETLKMVLEVYPTLKHLIDGTEEHEIIKQDEPVLQLVDELVATESEEPVLELVDELAPTESVSPMPCPRTARKRHRVDID